MRRRDVVAEVKEEGSDEAKPGALWSEECGEGRGGVRGGGGGGDFEHACQSPKL